MIEGKVVLVADDDNALLEMYSERVLAEGAIAIQARDGEETLKKIEEFHPSFIILDVMMPKYNGFEVLEKIKSNPVKKDIPVLILSALTDLEKKREGIRLGAIDFLVKSEVLPLQVMSIIKKEIFDEGRVRIGE